MDKLDLAGVSIAVTGFFAFLILMTGLLARIGLELSGTLRTVFLLSSLLVGLGGTALILLKRFG